VTFLLLMLESRDNTGLEAECERGGRRCGSILMEVCHWYGPFSRAMAIWPARWWNLLCFPLPPPWGNPRRLGNPLRRSGLSQAEEAESEEHDHHETNKVDDAVHIVFSFLSRNWITVE
jgi:hypothetical protein